MKHMDWKAFLFPYERAVEEMILKFTALDREYRQNNLYSPMDGVRGRLKKPTSILEKAKKKGFALHEVEERMEDIAGIRILCQFVEDIEKVAQIIREREDMTVVRERDYITKQKPSGYRSYHLIVRYKMYTAFGPKEVLAEIQIRTNAMNFWATAEHSISYKYSGNIPEELKQRLVECAAAAHRLDQEMATIRDEITQAQQVNEFRSNLMTEVLAKMQNLKHYAKADEMEEIDKKFLVAWNSDRIEAMKAFYDHLNRLEGKYELS